MTLPLSHPDSNKVENDLFQTLVMPLLVDEDCNPWLRVLRKMGDGVLICEKNGRICWMNEVLKEKLDLDPNQKLQLNHSVYSGEEEGALHEMDLAVQSTLETGQTIEKEINVRIGRDRKGYFEIMVLPLHEGVGIGLEDEERTGHSLIGCAVVFRDITPIKTTEKMRRDFVANVSHELRTPLSVLKGYAETLLAGALSEPETAKDFVQIIERHANRLSLLIEDLLDLSRLESADYQLELQPLWLQPLLERAFSMTKESAQSKGIVLSMGLPKELPRAMGNTSALEQVFINLIDNAIKYTPEQGKVAVDAKLVEGRIQFCVEDTGIGIPAKYIPRLFERFYRVDKARSREMGGTGLGLSIVKHIVQAHGGDIWVESVVNQGTRFFFTLKPVTPE